MTLRIGIDVGGTHTDAVLLDGERVRTSVKAATTADIESGVIDALQRLLAADRFDAQNVRAVMIGTTQFTNAVVERRELTPSAIVRIALPTGRLVPPKVDWPGDLAAALGDHVFMIHGGRLYDGRPLAPARDDEADAVIDAIAARELTCVAVASVFAPADAEPEHAFAERLQQRLPHVRVVRSCEFGRIGLLERENAALLNAALLPFADRVIDGFERALAARGLDCPLYISQNDGTLMDTAAARRFPALTFASGPTNSLRGAGLLTGERHAVVVDIGGTTSDIGVLRDGFPRESNLGVAIAGVRTSFRMPDILTLGIGGGSLVGAEGGRIGPRSVGHRLLQTGRAFGGDTLTATDLAIAAGHLDLGDRHRLADLPSATVRRGLATIAARIDEAVDRMRSSREPVTVILVGGGTALLSEPLSSAARTLRPEHAAVANAIGAAHAEVGAEAERIVPVAERAIALDELERQARQRVAAAGARKDLIRINDVDETAVSYMAVPTVRLRVKAVGPLDLEALAHG